MASYVGSAGVIISPMIPDRTSFSFIAFPLSVLFVLLLTSCQGPAGLSVEATGFPQRSTTTQVDQSLPGGTSSGDVAGSDVLQAAISTSTDAILNGINLRRAQEGLLPWLVEPPLVDYAYERSVDMAIRGFLDHTAPGDAEVEVLSALQERAYFGQAAELLFATQEPLQEVAQITLEAWFTDPNHEAVLLSPEFRYAGLGLMGDGSRWIVTLILVEGRP